MLGVFVKTNNDQTDPGRVSPSSHVRSGRDGAAAAGGANWCMGSWQHGMMSASSRSDGAAAAGGRIGAWGPGLRARPSCGTPGNARSPSRPTAPVCFGSRCDRRTQRGSSVVIGVARDRPSATPMAACSDMIARRRAACPKVSSSNSRLARWWKTSGYRCVSCYINAAAVRRSRHSSEATGCDAPDTHTPSPPCCIAQKSVSPTAVSVTRKMCHTAQAGRADALFMHKGDTRWRNTMC